MRLNSSLSSLRDDLEVRGVRGRNLIFADREGEKLADQLAVPFPAVQARPGEGDEDDQEHGGVDLLLDQIVLARPLRSQDRSGGPQRGLLAVRDSLRERHAPGRFGGQGNGGEVPEDAGRLGLALRPRLTSRRPARRSTRSTRPS